MTLFCLDVYSDLDDLFDVRQELLPVCKQWLSIGFALRLKISVLDDIRRNGGNPTDCLTSVVKEWLNRKYRVEEFGEPTWQRLVEAVSDPAGGANMALARDIAQRHKTGGLLNKVAVGRFHIFAIKCKHTPLIPI